ncbi:MAG: MFS transporter [Pirellulales bacterium]|nr:MFS transporter [Pirellulales bacterium]
MSEVPEKSTKWYHELTGYHWFVLVVCTLAWLFDCGDQQIFALARKPAMGTLLGVDKTNPIVDTYGGFATMIMLIGWATGGIIFGIMGDRVGRAKTMVWTILCYSIFTGLSGFSQTPWDFLLFRFLTGLGVGGQFAVGVSLVAEVMPERARAPALGLLQAFSAAGNVGAALMVMGIGVIENQGYIASDTSWRWMFAIGVIPALLAVVVMSRLKEPERWQKAVAEDGTKHQKAGSISELFGTPRWRKNVIVGMLLASAGVIGLWGIGFFSFDLNRSVFRKKEEQKCRDAGDAQLDQQFLHRLVHDPEAVGKVVVRREIKVEDSDEPKIVYEPALKPQSFISLDPENRDPRILFEAIVALTEDGKPVTVDSVVGALDTERKDAWKAQTAEERARRKAYLEVKANTKETPTIESEIKRIDARYKDINGEVTFWASITSMMFNIGAFFGVYVFSRVTQRIGRRPTFIIFFALAFFATVTAFLYMDKPSEVFWMVPLMGFFQLSVFGGYAIYFPELFPTRLRSTGVSFCYNIARFVSALGPAALGLLTSTVFADQPEPMRYAGVTMSTIFLFGIIVVFFAPETKDQPLPE